MRFESVAGKAYQLERTGILPADPWGPVGPLLLGTGQAMAIRVRLRELLEQRGMAQTELQAKTGLGYSTINALYHGKTERVEFATLDVLCEVLGCEIGDLLERESKPKRAR